MRFRFWKDWPQSVRREFIFTAIIAAFTVINAIATVVYVCTFSKSADETGRQTAQLITAAKIQADAATKNTVSAASMADSAEKQSINTHDLAAQALAQASATHELAKQSARQVAISQQTLGLERPWIGQSQQVYAANYKNELGGIRIIFKNGGRSPAINVRFRLFLVLGPPPQILTVNNIPIPEICKSEINGTGGNIVVPEGVVEIPATFESGFIQKNYPDFSSSKVGLYATGCIDYTDTAKRAHYRTNVFDGVFVPPKEAVDANGRPVPGAIFVEVMGNDAT